MRLQLRKALDWTIGLALIAVGLVGVLVPILPGVVFIVAGLAVLSSHSSFVRALQTRTRGLVKRVAERFRSRRKSP